MPGLRGAPKGNSNRLKHGRYTAANLAHRRRVRAAIRAARAIMAEADALIAAEPFDDDFATAILSADFRALQE